MKSPWPGSLAGSRVFFFIPFSYTSALSLQRTRRLCPFSPFIYIYMYFFCCQIFFFLHFLSLHVSVSVRPTSPLSHMHFAPSRFTFLYYSFLIYFLAHSSSPLSLHLFFLPLRVSLSPSLIFTFSLSPYNITIANSPLRSVRSPRSAVKFGRRKREGDFTLRRTGPPNRVQPKDEENKIEKKYQLRR